MRTSRDGVKPKKHLRLPLDPATDRWLRRLQRLTGDDPATMIASMLTMIRVDDERMHADGQTFH